MLNSNSTFADVVRTIIGLADGLMGLIVGIIIVIFIWRIFTAWFMGGGDPKEIERGKQSVFAGILILVVIFSLWAIVSMLRLTFFG